VGAVFAAGVVGGVALDQEARAANRKSMLGSPGIPRSGTPDRVTRLTRGTRAQAARRHTFRDRDRPRRRASGKVTASGAHNIAVEADLCETVTPEGHARPRAQAAGPGRTSSPIRAIGFTGLVAGVPVWSQTTKRSRPPEFPVPLHGDRRNQDRTDA
jgi:hypothetical protein